MGGCGGESKLWEGPGDKQLRQNRMLNGGGGVGHSWRVSHRQRDGKKRNRSKWKSNRGGELKIVIEISGDNVNCFHKGGGKKVQLTGNQR